MLTFDQWRELEKLTGWPSKLALVILRETTPPWVLKAMGSDFDRVRAGMVAGTIITDARRIMMAESKPVKRSV